MSRDGMSMTHIAGVTIHIGERTIQRCSVCGAKLCDNENTAAPLGPSGEVPAFPTWETGRLVRVTTGNPTAWYLLPDSDRLPEDACVNTE